MGKSQCPLCGHIETGFEHHDHYAAVWLASRDVVDAKDREIAELRAQLSARST